ncbi:UDP-N-acetylglucosamine-N-acetylmuramylpentapeptide N-acetylglucosamine transferase [Cnuella takakiae]|uniref:UDP-N-acetylglucosamine--N-acetylmuramyl-(pentapeptide) pyrophosphoryl-undecaprenol N-acetylglucosamine transferase n=1 Tax=Cnuella takakiae TaxID=1302690 RepID=A0A1M4WGW4_9BACT|nr:undecaprenyldiphospho-muramoylpentapeptide beta-N-acetylglucosaminyltransferase [Cnuella takakiae]SHE80531.1 UDP-N-acetylglucosamine-N-acetylmuramylpentapeptide N-acetylglucosamine transferase [Cnuella takakiae]
MTQVNTNTRSATSSLPTGEGRGEALRVIIAGGGTGGHIFPAIAIANALQKQYPNTEILFVGAKGKMEMEKVPQAGYRIEGLDIAGFNRSALWKNILLPVKLLKSFWQVRVIIRKFAPHLVVGVGGYSTFPVLRFAQAKGIPTFIHEANSFAGKSNMLLAKGATKVYTGTGGMEQFFPAEKIMVTGNPVRTSIANASIAKADALKFFGFDANKKTILVVGGSLGAKAINEAVDKHLDTLLAEGLQLIWQTGKPYGARGKERAEGKASVWVNEFITQMEQAYAAADVVISRAGAMSVAELSMLGKPTVFVPYPFAAEDHQTANAQYLVQKGAALMVKDGEAIDKVVPLAISLAKDEQQQVQLSQNIKKEGVQNADEIIAASILKEVGVAK